MKEKKLVISIARSYGSGGLTLAKKLGKELNLPVYDREILRMASDQSGISEEMFGQVDEHIRKIFLNRKNLRKRRFKRQFLRCKHINNNHQIAQKFRDGSRNRRTLYA